jgi:hypothetical protein
MEAKEKIKTMTIIALAIIALIGTFRLAYQTGYNKAIKETIHKQITEYYNEF